MIKQVTTHIHDSIHADECGIMLIFTHMDANIYNASYGISNFRARCFFFIYSLFHFESNDQEVRL